MLGDQLLALPGSQCVICALQSILSTHTPYLGKVSLPNTQLPDWAALRLDQTPHGKIAGKQAAITIDNPTKLLGTAGAAEA